MMFRVSAVLMCLLIGGWSLRTAQAQTIKKRIAVLSFEDKTDQNYRWGSKSAGEGMADMLITELVQSDRYTVLERTQINKVLQEQDLGARGIVTAQSAAEVGKMLGAELVIFGAITEFGYKQRSTGGATRRFGIGIKSTTAVVATDVRMVNATTGEIVAAENVRKEESKRGLSVDTDKLDFGSQSAFDESLVGEATREAIDRIVALIDNGAQNVQWSASVITVQNGNVFINAGANSGLENGQTLVVKKPGQSLVDPETGLKLGSVEKTIGTIRVTDNTMGSGRAAKCTIVSGSGFARGDIVRLQAE
ncbi:CsgG/HfaB family protein [Salisaeta longa]|uniref:CsgG/HfaB family protein n=1 Tax=Salisaeta longa TaxID=503170 RepID=UPI0009FC4F82|nr:CsgG/HfaB family protein [Salisaeta longa]